MKEAIERLYNINLGIRKGERILVFTDIIKNYEKIDKIERERRENLRRIAQNVAQIGSKYGEVDYLEYESLEEHGVEPPAELWKFAFSREACERLIEEGLMERLLKKDPLVVKNANEIINLYKEKAPDIVIALSNYSTTHTRFRALLTDICGTRYASMPLFEERMFYESMNVDWDLIAERSLKLKSLLDEGEETVIVSNNGTNLNLYIKDRFSFADTGILRTKGAFGNLPAGETFIAPVEGKSYGTLVLEWAPLRKLNSPLTLHIKDGRVVDIIGDDPYRKILMDKLSKNVNCSNIAELGIGTNDKANKPDNILESEKILGTVHIALGDNSTFGGNVKVPFHQDYILFEPTLKLKVKKKEKIILIDSGRVCF
jgi:leucyl aminopeptidase (aminopeptidase T)